jgi:hypothetical protein
MKGRRKRKIRGQEKRSPWTQLRPRGSAPELPIHSIGSWGPGVGLRRDPPQLLKGSRAFGVAAGGCPASPSWLRGRCEGQPRGCGGRGLGGPPGPPTVWVAGLTADLPRLPPSCEGMRRGSGADEGVPSGWRVPPSPCRQQVVWGAAAPKEYPVWGASGSPGTRRLSDDYWTIIDALSRHNPGQGRPPSLSGG